MARCQPGNEPANTGMIADLYMTSPDITIDFNDSTGECRGELAKQTSIIDILSIIRHNWSSSYIFETRKNKQHILNKNTPGNAGTRIIPFQNKKGTWYSLRRRLRRRFQRPKDCAPPPLLGAWPRFFFRKKSDHQVIENTLPGTNIAPKNGWLEYYFPIGEAYSQGLC